jgi:hypothetical protein
MENHTKNRMTHAVMQKPSRKDWMKYAGQDTEPTFTMSDKFMFGGLTLDIFILFAHDYGVLPDAVEWAGIGVVWGCILIAFVDALRRNLKLW